MEPFRVRAATGADVGALYRLVARAYRGESARVGWSHQADLVEGERIDEGELLEIIGNTAQAILVAEVAGAVIGCVQLCDLGGGVCTVELLCVEPRLQARGLGKRLVAAAEREAVLRFGARRMVMTVIEQRGTLVAYYERQGYAATGERRDFPVKGVDLPLIVMAKRVAGPG